MGSSTNGQHLPKRRSRDFKAWRSHIQQHFLNQIFKKFTETPPPRYWSKHPTESHREPFFTSTLTMAITTPFQVNFPISAIGESRGTSLTEPDTFCCAYDLRELHQGHFRFIVQAQRYPKSRGKPQRPAGDHRGNRFVPFACHSFCIDTGADMQSQRRHLP